LKSKGYRIAVTTLQQGVETLPPDKLPLGDKIALCFGCEEKGISDKLHDMADCYVRIPMYGFTDSLNLSVSVAICLSILTSRLRESGIPWQLSEADQNRLRFDWTRCSVKNVEQIIQRFEDENKNG
jgi:tRNA (guanosine-2'-O-)-methyltransferase